ncbi:MAG TPA: hypothetical protein VK604_24815, partial [Bryobacteraceae bacterium]|nr:hypothetical protein [Bryobacteraceae bacterium]
YETMHERAYHRCLNDLGKLRAERQKQEIGFASQTHKEKMRQLDLLCREADVNYHEARATGAQLHLECKENNFQTARTHQNHREDQEASTQQAA